MLSNEEAIELFRDQLAAEQRSLTLLLEAAAPPKRLLDAYSRVRLATLNLHVVERGGI